MTALQTKKVTLSTDVKKKERSTEKDETGLISMLLDGTPEKAAKF